MPLASVSAAASPRSSFLKRTFISGIAFPSLPTRWSRNRSVKSKTRGWLKVRLTDARTRLKQSTCQSRESMSCTQDTNSPRNVTFPHTWSRSRTRDFSRAVFHGLSCHQSSHAQHMNVAQVTMKCCVHKNTCLHT